MLKETGYQEKFRMLGAWLVPIIDTVKKDLRQEHLRVDREFCKRYFFGKSPQSITATEMHEAYQKDIEEGNVGLGEFIASRWLLKNTDLYGFFEEKIRFVSEDFDTLEELPLELSQTVMKESVEQFGASKTYIFSVLNSVVFPQSVYETLQKQAEQETKEEKLQEEGRKEKESLEVMQKRHAREMAALTNRYEKKLRGMEKKYLVDMSMLKKQVKTLQKKLS